ncbi:MAG: hypothetical protein LBT45_01275 [Rickettsiales bacterium]|jgi:hypothetical protein|nr:hypothetical protein [Rickettsiales bacterium]
MRKSLLSIYLFIFAAYDSSAAVLCHVPNGFACPIIANMSTDGGGYASGGGGIEDTWSSSGPWGGGGSSIVINGFSRCSDASGSPLSTGAPAAGGGLNCWCQMVVDNDVLGAWVFMQESTYTGCAANCSSVCAINFSYYSLARSAICSPSPHCSGMAEIKDGDCPAGYAQCVGTKTGDDDKGRYTITCEE